MNERLIQPRTYTDTFKGGEFELEMRENLSLTGPFGISLKQLDLLSHRDQDLQDEIEEMWKPFLQT